MFLGIKQSQFERNFSCWVSSFFLFDSNTSDVVKMGVYTFAAVFLVVHLMIPEETFGVESTSKSRLRGLERRYQLARYPLSDLLFEGKDEVLGKRQEQFDDYGHMRFGKRGEESDDYGHMRFGKRD